MIQENSLHRFKASLALVKVSKPNVKWKQLNLKQTSVEKFENTIWPRCA